MAFSGVAVFVRFPNGGRTGGPTVSYQNQKRINTDNSDNPRPRETKDFRARFHK
jgi:hypothetical protein